MAGIEKREGCLLKKNKSINRDVVLTIKSVIIVSDLVLKWGIE